MNKIYEKNMNYLKNLSEALYKKIDMTLIENIDICTSKDGKKNIKKYFCDKKIYIHSPYNVKLQSKYIANFINEDNSNIVFILGMGLGYEIKEMIKKSPNKRYFIVEPDTEVFKTALEILDIKYLFNDSNDVNFIQDDNSANIMEFFSRLVNYDKSINIKFWVLPSYLITYKNLISELNDSLKVFLNTFKNNFNVQLYSRRQWAQNYAINLKYLKDTTPVTVIKDKFKGIPAIIAAAGPSIEENLDALKTLDDGAIIATVGTGISILEPNGIKAHIMGAIDGWDTEGALFEDLKINENINLFYSTMVYHKVGDLNKGHKFLMNTVLMDSYISDNLDYLKMKRFSGSSITNSMVFTLSQLGCNPIIFLGQDMCYPNMKSHADSAKGFVEFDKDILESSKDEGYLSLKNKNGEDVYSDYIFLVVRESIEQVIKAHPHIQYLNGTKDGLKIKGAKDIDFNKFVEEHLKEKYQVNSILNKTVDEFEKNISKKQIENFIEQVEKDNNKIIDLCKDIIIDTENIINEKDNKILIENNIACLENIKFYNAVVKEFLEDVKYIYANREYFDKINQTYAYILDKCLIMKDGFEYGIYGGNISGK